jgi:predicted nucleic acid-binding protein
VIVVDTSVWVDVIRRPATPRAAALQTLLDADEIALPLPVRIELMSGIAQKDRAPFRRGLSALPLLVPTDETWQRVESWIAPAANAGFRFAVTDLLIAAMTSEHVALAWSLDADFAAMESLGFVHLYQ